MKIIFKLSKFARYLERRGLSDNRSASSLQHSISDCIHNYIIDAVCNDEIALET